MSSHSHDAPHSHIAPKSLYFAIFGILMVLTIVTVAVSRVDLGRLNVVIALLVALMKASVVVLYFMHVKYSSALTKLTAACGFLWLIFMFVITFSDYLTRDLLPLPKSWLL